MLIRHTAMMAHANQCNAHHNVLPVSTISPPTAVSHAWVERSPPVRRWRDRVLMAAAYGV